ncbi:zinc finger protein 225-like [Anoplophora glabripennis]|uniref:zinc finger protein 225-like n=1 Tax=Anoplophora glabripennis TaxID=217634 RepID=UPI00087388BB|nr:zinc finger protein 225-like [Anoplophora glabripennis]
MYTCDICSKGFAYRSGLRRHANKHKSITFPCDTCGKKFTRQYNLIAHRETKHQQIIDNSELTAHDMNSTYNRKYIYRPLDCYDNETLNMDNDEQLETDCESSEYMLERESGDDPKKLVNDLRYYIEECRLTKEHHLCSGIINKLHDMGIIQ